jgi:Outer membrane protein (OmpH-like).
MKNISLILNIVLTAAVIALYVLFFTGKDNKPAFSTAEGQEALVLPGEGSIVYIQVDSLMNQFDMFHALRTELEAKAKVIDDDLTKKGRAFERDVNDFEEKIQKGLLTRSQAETQQQLLANRQQELQQYSQQKQMELAEEEQVLLNRVLDELKTFLAGYNETHNYSLILTTSGATNNIITASPALNITKDVVNGLNAKYAAQKRK